MRRTILFAGMTVLVLAFATAGGSVGQAAVPNAANVQVTASQGEAAPGNAYRAHLLVVVTSAVTSAPRGTPVVGLPQSSFTVVNHFSLPGQECGFSNNIETFVDVGTGAYQLEVAPKGCDWVEGDYLTQVIVQAPAAVGQGSTALHIEVTRHPLDVQVSGLQGDARPGNDAQVTLMVNVTDRITGDPMYGLPQSSFQMVMWGPTPGGCGFNHNDFTNFGEYGTGIYWMTVKLHVAGCTWAEGDYVFTMWVYEPPAGEGRQGQTNAVLHIANLP